MLSYHKALMRPRWPFTMYVLSASFPEAFPRSRGKQREGSETRPPNVHSPPLMHHWPASQDGDVSGNQQPHSSFHTWMTDPIPEGQTEAHPQLLAFPGLEPKRRKFSCWLREAMGLPAACGEDGRILTWSPCCKPRGTLQTR